MCYFVYALIGRSTVERIRHRFAGWVEREEKKKLELYGSNSSPTSSAIVFT